MGRRGLPRAVTSIALDRDAGPLFEVGIAEMNGWRPTMEDAHVSVMQDSWGFFGVFDGHGGSECSSFVAKRLQEELRAQPLLADDAAVKSLMLRIDQEFLDTKQPSGSTGTFALVVPSAEDITLRVGNIGDSRVLLGRADGSMVEGPGTDGGLTTDHKPDNKLEQERILRTGGTVMTRKGIARVNGELSVSRAFGDALHKQTGGPKQEDHPISAEPEFTTMECAPSDFLLLVCDGISEGNFPNRDVVRLAADELSSKDSALAAAAVCRKALERGSRDNLSCMIVLLRPGEQAAQKELCPGPFSMPTHAAFRQAYTAMTMRAGITLEAALEQRYTMASQQLIQITQSASQHHSEQDTENVKDKDNNNGENGSSATMLWTAQKVLEQGTSSPLLADLYVELMQFAPGPPSMLAAGSRERIQWFKEWLEFVNSVHDPELYAVADGDEGFDEGLLRVVRVMAADVLRPAVEAHTALDWDDSLLFVCEQWGKVLRDDPSEKTAEVRIRSAACHAWAWLVWLPWECLEDDWMYYRSRTVRVARALPLQSLGTDAVPPSSGKGSAALPLREYSTKSAAIEVGLRGAGGGEDEFGCSVVPGEEDVDWGGDEVPEAMAEAAEASSLGGTASLAWHAAEEPRYHAQTAEIEVGGSCPYTTDFDNHGAGNMDSEPGLDDPDQSLKEVAACDPAPQSAPKRKPDDACHDGSHKYQKY